MMSALGMQCRYWLVEAQSFGGVGGQSGCPQWISMSLPALHTRGLWAFAMVGTIQARSGGSRTLGDRPRGGRGNSWSSHVQDPQFPHQREWSRM